MLILTIEPLTKRDFLSSEKVSPSTLYIYTSVNPVPNAQVCAT